MFLQQLEVAGFRNLQTPRLRFDSRFNAFWGRNGSGKTSVLEAIYVLGMGRSFRASNLQRVIQLESDRYALGGYVRPYVDLDNVVFKIGTEKELSGAKKFKLAGNKCSPADVARILPLQAITIDSHKLIEAGPENRRQFADWVMFHVEHEFLEAWKAFKYGLLQRNALLKQGGARRELLATLKAWQEGFVVVAEKIDEARKKFLLEFEPVLLGIISDWLPDKHVCLSYKQGWNKGFDYREALEKGLELDLMTGFTGKGPHRADIDILVNGIQAKDILSRGQQKLLVCSMLLARAKILAQKKQVKSIFLLDDISSELDDVSSSLLLRGLSELECQIFVTNIEREPLEKSLEAVGPSGGSFFKMEGGVASVLA